MACCHLWETLFYDCEWLAASLDKQALDLITSLLWSELCKKKLLAAITYCDWFLFQIYSSSNTKSQASSFFFVQDDKVRVLFALTEKWRWRGRGRKRKTKPKIKIKFLHKWQIPSDYSRLKKPLKELKLRQFLFMLQVSSSQITELQW